MSMAPGTCMNRCQVHPGCSETTLNIVISVEIKCILPNLTYRYLQVHLLFTSFKQNLPRNKSVRSCIHFQGGGKVEEIKDIIQDLPEIVTLKINNLTSIRSGYGYGYRFRYRSVYYHRESKHLDLSSARDITSASQIPLDTHRP